MFTIGGGEEREGRETQNIGVRSLFESTLGADNYVTDVMSASDLLIKFQISYFDQFRTQANTNHHPQTLALTEVMKEVEGNEAS